MDLKTHYKVALWLFWFRDLDFTLATDKTTREMQSDIDTDLESYKGLHTYSLWELEFHCEIFMGRFTEIGIS